MQDKMENQTLTEQLLSLFENHIVKSAKEVAEIETQHKTDWFAQSEHILMIHIDLRNKAYKSKSCKTERSIHIPTKIKEKSQMRLAGAFCV